MKITIVGNGIIALMAAYRLIKDDPSLRIVIVGPEKHPGCASLAAAAMFNSFCEIEPRTLKNEIELKKFEFNYKASFYWPELILSLRDESKKNINYGFGTYLLNNHSTDELEDTNFDSIIDGLKHFKEDFQWVNPKDITNYKPTPQHRASRAIYIPREGWINPFDLIFSLKQILANSLRVSFVDDSCEKLLTKNDIITDIELSSKKIIPVEYLILAPGANFSSIIKNSGFNFQLIEIFYGIGASILLHTGNQTVQNCVRTPNRGLACGLYTAPQDENHTLIGASNLISATPDYNVNLTSIHTLIDGAMNQINTDYYRSKLVKINVGWRPTSADTVPLIGPLQTIKNVFVATGTKRDGLHCSPLIAEIISNSILKNIVPSSISLFSPERAPHKFYTRHEAIDIATNHTINAAYQHGFISSRNKLTEDLRNYYRDEFEKIHDQVGAIQWGIPPELLNMYKYGHIKS